MTCWKTSLNWKNNIRVKSWLVERKGVRFLAAAEEEFSTGSLLGRNWRVKNIGLHFLFSSSSFLLTSQSLASKACVWRVKCKRKYLVRLEFHCKMPHSIVGKRSPNSLLLYVSDSNIHQMTLVLLRKHEKDRLKIVIQRRLGLIVLW